MKVKDGQRGLDDEWTTELNDAHTRKLDMHYADVKLLETKLRGLRYKLAAGRVIEFDGQPMLTLERAAGEGLRYTLSPVEADELAHRIVHALNAEEFGDKEDK